MRKCKGRYYKSGKYHEFALGYFHQWGNNYEEFETGPGNFSTAIVELPDGEIIMPQADDIQFLKNESKNDDLISRSALAEEIKSLRVYMTGIRAGKGFLIEFMEEYKKSVLKCIDEAPVAYDPDAVCNELDKIMQNDSIRFVDQAVNAGKQIVRNGVKKS